MRPRVAPADQLPAGDWEEVPQLAQATAHADCALSLGPFRRDRGIRLWLLLRPSVTTHFGWVHGTRLALAVGRSGEAAGWVRFQVAPGGRPLRHMGRHTTSLVAMFEPGEWLGGFEAPRRAAEWKAAGGALLVRLPWDLVAEAAEAAEGVAA
jgi:hypothetical protein